MADENPKSNDDTTGYKNAPISIPKAIAMPSELSFEEAKRRYDTAAFAVSTSCMSREPRKFWALFWAQVFWLLCVASLALAAWQYAGMLSPPECKNGGADALLTDCSRE